MDPYRIVHISDLHFGGAFDAALWSYVKSLVAQVGPQLIVVSGDVVDSPQALRLLLAKKELQQLKQDSGADKLFVIPGNHDITALGNVRLPRSSKLFWRIFLGDTAAHDEHLTAPPWKDDWTERPVRRYFR